MKKESLSITSMTCASCAKAVEKSVGKLEDVISANVNFATEKLTVEFDEGKADMQTIKDAIQKAGYEISRN